MIDIIELIAAFVVGAVAGSYYKPTVDSAIAQIKAAEAKAKATLDKITAHKAS